MVMKMNFTLSVFYHDKKAEKINKRKALQCYYLPIFSIIMLLQNQSILFRNIFSKHGK